MELAIGVMFLMIAFTIMLLSTAGLQNRHRNDDYKDFNQMIEINNVGEYALKAISEDEYSFGITENNIDYSLSDYTIQKDEYVNEYKIYRGDGEEKELILTITLSDDGKTITSWK